MFIYHIFCLRLIVKNVGYDWGVIITLEGTDWPCLKISSLVTTLNHGKDRKLFKKWKEVPFKICEAELEEMIEELQSAIDEKDV